MEKKFFLAILLVSFGMVKAQWNGPTGFPYVYYNGKVGINTGTADPGTFGFRVHGAGHFGDSYDPSLYGAGIQIVRPADQGDEKFHLAFVRGGNTIAGMGYARNSNLFGIWITPPQGTYSTPTMAFLTNGNIGIGTTDPGSYKLAVEGSLGARRVKITLASWADYVFESSYKLRSLKEVEAYIKQYKHLPEVPTTKEIERDGADVGDTQALLLKKIEELTLYVIEQNKKLEVQQQKIEALEAKLK